MNVCTRITTANPAIPASTVIAETTTSAATLVPVPPPQPRRVNTVAGARVASPPGTQRAAGDSPMGGPEPRLPASAITPQNTNEITMPTIPAITACQNDT